MGTNLMRDCRRRGQGHRPAFPPQLRTTMMYIQPLLLASELPKEVGCVPTKEFEDPVPGREGGKTAFHLVDLGFPRNIYTLS